MYREAVNSAHKFSDWWQPWIGCAILCLLSAVAFLSGLTAKAIPTTPNEKTWVVGIFIVGTVICISLAFLVWRRGLGIRFFLFEGTDGYRHNHLNRPDQKNFFGFVFCLPTGHRWATRRATIVHQPDSWGTAPVITRWDPAHSVINLESKNGCFTIGHQVGYLLPIINRVAYLERIHLDIVNSQAHEVGYQATLHAFDHLGRWVTNLIAWLEQGPTNSWYAQVARKMLLHVIGSRLSPSDKPEDRLNRWAEANVDLDLEFRLFAERAEEHRRKPSTVTVTAPQS